MEMIEDGSKKDVDENKNTLLVYGELDEWRGQHRVEGTDRHLTSPLTLFFGVYSWQRERTVSTKVAIAWVFLSDDFWLVSVK